MTLPGAYSFHAVMKSNARFHWASFKLSMSVEIKVVLVSPVTSRTESISSSLIVTVGIPHYADGLALALGEAEALGLSDGDSLADGDTDNDAEALGLIDALGDTEADGDAL